MAHATGPAIHDLQSVQDRRRSGGPEPARVTLTARVSLAGLANVRVTARPVVGAIADPLGPRLELHAEGGTSVVLEGPTVGTLVEDSLAFLRDAKGGAERVHDHVFGLTAAFDLATGPFVTLEPPAFLVAGARTVLHESGAVALRIIGEDRALLRGPEHALPRPGERVTHVAFEMQIASREAGTLRAILESVRDDLGPVSLGGRR